jgi:hypothetical protein
VTAEPLPVEADGDVVSARRRLSDAISALCDSRSEMAGDEGCPDCRMESCPGHMMWVASWYEQLQDSLAGEQGAGFHATQARSVPPLWVDAAQTLMEIDEAVGIWEPRPNVDVSEDDPPPMTIIRLQAIGKRQWTPQQTKKMDDLTDIIAAWVKEIEQLFSVEPVRALWAAKGGGFAACPACSATMAKKEDRCGERVQYPALQLSNDGTTRCMACRTSWGPDLAMFVCRSLGYPTPAGVLE